MSWYVTCPKFPILIIQSEITQASCFVTLSSSIYAMLLSNSPPEPTCGNAETQLRPKNLLGPPEVENLICDQVLPRRSTVIVVHLNVCNRED